MSTHCEFCGKRKIAPKVKKHPATLHWRADPYCSRKCLEADKGIVDRGGLKAPVQRERVA